tara:strand:+ start:1018 stop:1701 length:684 start_codon:yes stop_codon:yes gene_type:complete
MIKNILNLGDAAVYCDFGEDVNEEINSNVISYFDIISKLIKSKEIKGILNLTPSYNKLIVNFDLSITKYSEVKKAIEELRIDTQKKVSSNNIKIPVCVDNKFGLDYERLTKITNQSKEEILELFFQKEYFCYMTGFIAGMPFLGDINKKIRCERLETPRLKVPKGSVGLTQQFTNIYTSDSPGGWNIIGNTPLKVFDSKNENKPNLISPGDKVNFYEISKEEYDSWK